MKMIKSYWIMMLTSSFIFLSIFSFCQKSIIHTVKAGYSYKDNSNYLKRMKLFEGQKDHKDIVMLGDSHTERGQWEALLGRTDITNRGIGSDIFEGYINRINDIFDLRPKICFIQGGGNDLGRGVSRKAIIKKLALLIDTLRSENIIPVLKTVDYVADSYRSDNPKVFNKKVKQLNRAIVGLAKDENITLINLNTRVSDKNYLLKECAIDDGVHYTEKVYFLWKEEIIKVLDKYKLN